MTETIFSKIVAGEIPCFKVHEDEKHLAFLSPFGNTDGFTVVITKEWHSSNAFHNDDTVLSGLLLFTKQVAKKIENAFPDVERVGLFSEGYGVDHLHFKLFPMHGTADGTIKEEKRTEFYEKYPGFLSSHDMPEMHDSEKLTKIAKQIFDAKWN